VLTVSSPRQKAPHFRRRVVLAQIAFATMAALGFGALVAVAPATPAEAVTSPSEITIKWDGDTSSARTFQPTRDSSSPHYNEMKGISVTVSQTKDIIDQSIRVSISGFAGTRSAISEGVQNGGNFIQAMQCYGADPNAVNGAGGYRLLSATLSTSTTSSECLRRTTPPPLLPPTTTHSSP